MDNKKEQERAELHRVIWNIANDLRGSVDGWDFKQYVLGMLFYRYISENLAGYINRGEWEAGNAEFDYAAMSDADAEEARAGLVVEKGFFILPSELFENVRRKAPNDDNLNETLESVFQNIADEIFADRLSKNDDKSAAIGFIYSLLEAERMGKISYKKSNFYIAQENDNMDNITKLATLLPTKLTITNMCSIVSQIDHGVYHDARIKGLVEWERYCFLPSGDFRSWLRGSLPLLNAGIISYYPNTVDFLIYPDGREEKDKEFTVEATDTCACNGQIKNKEYVLSKIAELEIPYLYDVPLSDFGKISIENMPETE